MSRSTHIAHRRCSEQNWSVVRKKIIVTQNSGFILSIGDREKVRIRPFSVSMSEWRHNLPSNCQLPSLPIDKCAGVKHPKSIPFPIGPDKLTRRTGNRYQNRTQLESSSLSESNFNEVPAIDV